VKGQCKEEEKCTSDAFLQGYTVLKQVVLRLSEHSIYLRISVSTEDTNYLMQTFIHNLMMDQGNAVLLF
jgi:hypothetical protein